MTPWLEGFALWLADFYLAATLLLLAACAALTLLKQPARRMAVAWGTCIALLLAAVLCGVASRPRVDLRGHLASPAPQVVEIVTAEAMSSPPRPTPNESFEARPAAPVPQTVAQPPIEVDARTERVAEAAPEPAIDYRQVLAGGLCLFLIGSVVITARLGVGVWRAVRLVRDSGVAPPELIDELRSIVGGDARLPRLRLNGQLVTPVATGTVWPTIALPEHFYRTATRDELRAALAHEWAHIRNGDLWLLAVDRCLLPLLWAHPVFWAVRRRARQDQEFLADAAAASLADPADYAAQLVAWARDLAGIKRVAVSHAVGIWERPTGLALRISNLLNHSDRTLLRCSWRTRLAVVACLAVVGMLAASPSFRPPRAEAKPPEKEASRPPAEPAKTAEFKIASTDIGGTCIDREENPLAGVDVALYRITFADEGQQLAGRMTTNAAGQFAFRNVAPLGRNDGRYTLVARSKGLRTEIRPIDWRRPGWVDLKLGKSATLTGIVLNRQGQPVVGALVFPYFDQSGLKKPIPGVHCATTDVRGKFTIDDLGPYKFIEPNKPVELRLSTSDNPPDLVVDHPDYVRTRTPYMTVPSNVEIVVKPGGVIDGQVVRGDSGKPVAGLLIALQGINQTTPEAQYFWATTFTDRDGRFRLQSLPTGQFNVYPRKLPTDVTAAALDSVRVYAGQTTKTAPIGLIAGGFVKGRLIDDATNKPAQLEDGEEVRFGFHGPMRPKSGASVVSASVKKDGTFEKRLPPGDVHLYVMNGGGPYSFAPKPGGYFTTDANGRRMPVTDMARDIEIVEGKETPVEFRVLRTVPPKKKTEGPTRKDSSLKVWVVNDAGRPVSGATLIVGWPGAKNAPYNKQQFKSDASGSVELPSSTGPRRLLALASDDELAGQTLAKPDEVEATVTIAKAVRLHGRLLNMELNPVRRRRLVCSITDAKGDETIVYLKGQTDAAGEFVFAGVPSGARARLFWLNPLDKMYGEGVSFVCRGTGKVELGDILDREFIVSWTKDRMDEKWLPPMTHMARMSWDEMNAANGDFSEAYSLNEGQNVRRFYHHAGDVRRRWVERHHGGNAGIGEWGPALTLARYKEKTLGWSATFSGGPNPERSLKDVIESVSGLGNAEIEGPNKLLQTRVMGDFLFRLGSPIEKRVAELEKILWDECQLRVQLNLEEEARKVFVAEGTFQLKPLPKHPGAVVLYSEAGPDGPDINGRGGGSGSFRDFLEATANHIQRRIVNGVSSPPQTQVEWFFTDGHAVEAVLKHVTEQTGLTFREETRTMRVLHVE